MAKSKSGGTRSYIRGRVGADVYSIGKDGAGKKQQVVRSLAESVANPQTESQMRGRMIMSTVMQAASGLKPIIDHSFDGISGRQGNISEFVKRNYALIKADVAANPASNNVFGLNKYQEKGAKVGAYIISNGEAVWPAALRPQVGGMFVWESLEENVTLQMFMDASGLTTEDFLTVVAISTTGEVKYGRIRINPEKPATTALADDCFLIEANADVLLETVAGLTFGFNNADGSVGFIISKATQNGYVHNTATMLIGDGAINFTADVALPTYPQGNADFLNGGDLFGLSEETGA